MQAAGRDARFVILAAADEMPARLGASLGVGLLGLWRGVSKMGDAPLWSDEA